jgi:hypothetical protein
MILASSATAWWMSIDWRLVPNFLSAAGGFLAAAALFPWRPVGHRARGKEGER